MQTTSVKFNPYYPLAMNDMLLLLKQLHWLVPTTFLVNIANLLFGDCLFLSLTADAQEVVKLCLTFASLLLTVLGAKFTLGKMRNQAKQGQVEAQQARDKLYMERVRFLKENELLPKSASADEIERAISEHFDPDTN